MSDIPTAGTPVGFPFFMHTINLKHKNGTVHPTVHLVINLARGPMLGLRMPMSAVATALHLSSLSLAMEFSQKPGAAKQHWQLAIASTYLNLGSLISPPVKARVPPTQMIGWPWRMWTAPEIVIGTLLWVSVKMVPTTGVISLTQTVTHGRVLPTSVPSQQVGIASCTCTLRWQQSSLPARSSAKRCRPFVALLRWACRRRPSWGRLVIVARLCGGATMRLSRQSGISLSMRTTVPLK